MGGSHTNKFVGFAVSSSVGENVGKSVVGGRYFLVGENVGKSVGGGSFFLVGACVGRYVAL